jgi:general secretion pathway protein G
MVSVREKGRVDRGFTLLELLVVIAIMGTLASIAVPCYRNMLGEARGNIAVNDIKNLQMEIDLFKSENGRLPDCLDELPGGNKLDPWGNPYQYLNYDATEKEKGGGSEKEKGGGGGSEKVKGGECTSNSDGGGKEKQRKDRFLHPLNMDYDLYSMGEDGKSSAPLTAKASHDDIIRANDGQYIGVAANY